MSWWYGFDSRNLSKNDNNFEITKFNDLSGLGIAEILTNILSCHGFVKSSTPKVILTYHSALVPHYLSKGFIFAETEEGVVDNIPTTVKIQTHDDNLHQEDILISCKVAIP